MHHQSDGEIRVNERLGLDKDELRQSTCLSHLKECMLCYHVRQHDVCNACTSLFNLVPFPNARLRPLLAPYKSLSYSLVEDIMDLGSIKSALPFI